MPRKPQSRRVPRARNASAVDEPPKRRSARAPAGPHPKRQRQKGEARKAQSGSGRATAKPAAAAARKPGQDNKRPAPAGRSKGIWLYGRHAIEAALANPRRSCHRLIGTAEALARLAPSARRSGLQVDQVEPDELDRRLGETAVHQGLALSVAPLPRLDLERSCRPEPAGRNLVIVLDRVQDPHNLGAILRSAAAFDARAVVVPDRGSAALGGVAARAAAGALDLVPVVEVTNVARALEDLKGLGYWRLALDGDAEATIETAPALGDFALVLGAEGAGLRRLVAERCDLRVRLPVAPAMESLNVSVACGIALYALSRSVPAVDAEAAGG